MLYRDPSISVLGDKILALQFMLYRDPSISVLRDKILALQFMLYRDPSISVFGTKYYLYSLCCIKILLYLF